MKNNHVSVLQVDLKAVKFNLNYFKSKLPITTQIIAVVKAYGYGGDAVEIAKSIENDVAYFAVAYTDEGIALRNAGIDARIIVLHPHLVNLKLDVKYNLEPNLYNCRVLDAFIDLAKQMQLKTYPIHIKFNTGLNRLGFNDGDIKYITSKIKNNKTVKVATLFSHLAASEDKNEQDFTLTQISKFENIATSFTKKIGYKPDLHITNTSGIINYPHAHYNLVRLGIGLYGFGNDEKETSTLKNVLSLKSVISQIHTIEKGESVGYNRAFVAKNKIKTATIPIGHADGISRQLGNRVGFVTINNQQADIIGNVCMDMIMIDITNIECEEGDEIVLFDNQKKVELLAQKTNTISYELITAISQRIKRQFLR